MPKRMTATDIWTKEWFMLLEPRLKCLVRFIWDHCDNAGVWSPNWTLASLMIGEKVGPADMVKIDEGERHEILNNGKIWVKDFIKFQCGNSLNEKSPPHKKVLDLLEEHGLINRVLDTLTNRVLDTPKEKEIEKEKRKEKEIEKETPVLVYPFDSERFINHWAIWTDYKKTEFKFTFKSLQSEQAALTKLGNMADDETEAIEIINESMANGWKGLFNLEKNKNGTDKAKNAATGALKRRGLL